MTDLGAHERRDRQRALVVGGLHPLTLLGPTLRLHATAPAHGLDPAASGSRCGTCSFRVRVKVGPGQMYPKCTFPGRGRPTSSGPAADVRAWWPACVDYQPRPGGDGG